MTTARLPLHLAARVCRFVRPALTWLQRRRAPAAEKPLRDELLSIERLEERALALAASLTIDPNPRRRARDTFPRFEDNVRVLRARVSHAGRRRARRAVRRCRPRTGCSTTSTSSRPRSPTSAGTCRAPTRARCRRWRRASTPARPASTRWRSSSSATATAAWIGQQLIQFLNSYQRVAPLTIGELWAWPSMLKLALIENLRRLAEELLVARGPRAAPPTATCRRAERDTAARPRCRRAPIRPSSCSCCTASASTDCACRRFARAVDDDLAVAADDGRGDDPRRAPAAGRGAGLGGQRRHQPAPVRDARLAGVRRVGQPGRAACCSAIRRARTGAWTS